MNRIKFFLIGAAYLCKLLKLKFAIWLLVSAEGVFLRLTGWRKMRDKSGRWTRGNQSRGYTISGTHTAASTTWFEVPEMMGRLYRECRFKQAPFVKPKLPMEKV